MTFQQLRCMKTFCGRWLKYWKFILFMLIVWNLNEMWKVNEMSSPSVVSSLQSISYFLIPSALSPALNCHPNILSIHRIYSFVRLRKCRWKSVARSILKHGSVCCTRTKVFCWWLAFTWHTRRDTWKLHSSMIHNTSDCLCTALLLPVLLLWC